MPKIRRRRHIWLYKYIYICCRVKTWSKIWGFLSQNLVQGCVKTWSKIFVCLFFPQFYSVFWICLKSQIVCRGAKIFFGNLSGCQKRVIEKKCALFVFVFFMLEKVKRKMWKNREKKFQTKNQKNCVFWVVVKKMVFFVKMSFLGKIGKHYLCSEGKKRCAFSLQLSVFGKCSFFWCPFKVTKHYKNRGLQKCHFGFSLEKGFYYLWYLKAVLCWKHNFYSVFSKTQLCRHERMQLEQKQKFTKNRGCLPKCKRSFFGMCFFCFLVILFFVACVFVLCFVKKAQKGYFPAILEVFCLFCSHQRPIWKCFFSSYFDIFAFVFPFKNPFFAFDPSTPFTEDSLWGFFSFSFACLFLS